MKMKIKFWGCRGSIPVPDSRMLKYGGNTTCVEIDLDGHLLIIDAGTGIRKLGEELVTRDIRKVDMFITHSHWDHIQGFPFFKLIYQKESNIRIFGCTSSYKQIKDIFARQMSYEYFPVRFSDLKSRIEFLDLCNEPFYIEDYKITTIRNNHPIYTLGIKIESPSGKFVFITDNELMMENPDTDFGSFVEFCRGADYLIHDAQFDEEQYEKSRNWGHSSYSQAIDLACKAGVSNLGFFHHDPDRKDSEIDKMEKRYKKAAASIKKGRCKVFAVREYSEIVIGE